MGLDMYLHKAKCRNKEEAEWLKNLYMTAVQSGNEDDLYKAAKELAFNHEELHYWRKHNRLHGYMNKLFNKLKGDNLPNLEFNDVPVLLGMEALIDLEKAVKSKALPKTTGFFFGEDSYTRSSYDHVEEDLKAVEKAKEALQDGHLVYYNSWW